jgi:S1-C subfamily serine protease
MSKNTSILATVSDEVASLVGRVGAVTLAIQGRGRRPITATVIGPELAVGIHHVIDADEVRVRTADDRTFDATSVGRDDTRDLVLLRVPGLDVVPLSASISQPQLGELVLSVSRTWNNQHAVSLGVLGSIGGPIRLGRVAAVPQVLYADVNSTPGISGSPLVTMSGEVIGIVNAGLLRGVPLALPIATVDQAVKALAEHGRIRRGFLGVGLQPVAVPERQHGVHRRGLLVVGIEAGSPAEQAGLLVGDVIVTAAGEATADTSELQRFLTGERVGSTLTLEILRGGALSTLGVTVGERG